jgi:hypothetical protein
MPRILPYLVLILTAALLMTACSGEETPVAAGPQGTPAPALPDKEPLPPTPPLKENFDGEPEISLFPRVGDFSPEAEDKEAMGYWLTFIDHLLRTSGPVRKEEGRAFAIRGIRTIDSVGFFAPLAVEPNTEYRVAYRVWSKLPAGAATGVGYLEYDQFLWVGEQFPRSLSQQHFRGAREGLRLTGKQEGARQEFTLRSGPETRMIHLVFFIEGETDRDPVLIDDIEITPAAPL